MEWIAVGIAIVAAAVAVWQAYRAGTSRRAADEARAMVVRVAEALEEKEVANRAAQPVREVAFQIRARGRRGSWSLVNTGTVRARSVKLSAWPADLDGRVRARGYPDLGPGESLVFSVTLPAVTPRMQLKVVWLDESSRRFERLVPFP